MFSLYFEVGPDKWFRDWRKIGGEFLGTGKPQPRVLLNYSSRLSFKGRKWLLLFPSTFYWPSFSLRRVLVTEVEQRKPWTGIPGLPNQFCLPGHGAALDGPTC